MVSLWPGGWCEPCEDQHHEACLGWRTDLGYAICGCADGGCRERLTRHDNQGETHDTD